MYDITIANGKYRFVYDDKFQFEVYRYGERWPVFEDMNQHSNAILSLVAEISELREKLAEKEKGE